MLCPACNHTLLPLHIHAKARQITVDYCQHCGGIWTDHGDINFLELTDVASFDYYLPKEPYYIPNETLVCPKDRTVLEIFKGESVPVNLDLYQCSKCHGYFFPFKHIVTFKNAQSAKINYYKIWNIPLPSIYSVVLPVLAIIMIGGLAAGLFAINKQQEIRTRARELISQPYLVQPTPTVTHINFITQQPTSSKIRYWTIANQKTEVVVSSTQTTVHAVKLENLVPNQQYYFEVIIYTPDEFASPQYTFTTATN